MILKTTKSKGRKSHDHMGYILPTGQGVTSPGEDGHVHIINLVGQLPDGTPQFEIEDAAGHSHQVGQINLSKHKKNDMTDEERVEEVLSLYKARKDVLQDNFRRFEQHRQIYLSNQWPEGVEKALDRKRRAHHNINEIKPKIDLIQGYLTENRTKRKYKPVEDDDGTVAEVLNRINYHIDSKTNYSIEEEQVIEDQLQKGMGVLQIRVDTTNNLQGEVIEEHFNPEDVLFGPHEKLDASDCEFAIKRKWISKHKAKSLFPELADRIETSIIEPTSMGVASDDRDDHYDRTTGKMIEDLSPDLYDMSKKNVRVLELLKVEYRRVPVVYDIENNFYLNAEDLKVEDLRELLTIPLLREQRKVFTKVTSTKVVGTVFAEHVGTPFKSLPIRPVYCLKEGSYAYSLVHFVTDLQNMANKSRSLYSDIIAKAAEYVWLAQRGALTSQQVAAFKKNKVEPGSLIEVENIGQIRKEEGSRVPSEILALEDRYSSMIFDHMGGNSVLLDKGSSGGSALLYKEFKRQSLLGLRYLQRNLHITKQAMARLRLEAISAVYSPERIARLINLDSNFHITTEDVEEALSGLDLLEFDVEIVEDSSASTFKDEQFAIWAELLSSPAFAASIPPSVSMQFLLEMANPPGKEKLLAMLGQVEQESKQERLSTQELQLLASQPDEIKKAEYVKNQGQIQGVPPEQLPQQIDPNLI